jgi:hypothetical protein
MHRGVADKEEEEEYDPTNPAVGSVASVVRVKPRPKVPAALQANKNLILKAMAEAHKSVASAPKRIEPDEVSQCNFQFLCYLMTLFHLGG